MARPTVGPSSSSIVIFDSSSTSTTFHGHPNDSIFLSCQNGPQKLTGFVKRGRPRKERQKRYPEEFDEDSQNKGYSSTSKFSFVTYTTSPKNAATETKRLVRRRAMLHYHRQEKKNKSVPKEAKNSKMGHPFLKTVKDGDELIRSDNVGDGNSPSLSSTTKFLPKEITDVDPFNAFPIKIAPYMLDLLLSYTTSIYETMYTIERHVNVNPPKDYWLPMAFQDAALLHAFLFCADGHGTIAKGKKEGPAAVVHLRKAIQIVNERLSAPVPSVTDATIAVVCTFAHTEILNGNYENWKLHMRGLKQMIRQRDGMQAFESNRLLRSKMNRADLAGSTNAVRSPYLELVVKELPKIPSHDQMMAMTKILRGLSNSVKLDEALTRILCQVQNITLHLNIFYDGKSQMHPLDLREAITSAQYSLLSFKPHQNFTTREGFVHEILRLTLLIYLGTLLDESPPGILIYDAAGEQLKSLIEIRDQHWLDSKLSLWIMFLAASVVRDLETKSYFLASAAGIAEELGISSWDDVEAIFKSFFWVESIHKETFKLVWDVLHAPQ